MIIRKFTAQGVNLLTTTTTTGVTIGTTDNAGRRFVIIAVMVEITAVTGTLTVPAAITIGVNAAGTGLATALVTGLTGANLATQTPVGGTTGAATVAPNTAIVAGITAATGTLLTVVTGNISVLGYYSP